MHYLAFFLILFSFTQDYSFEVEGLQDTFYIEVSVQDSTVTLSTDLVGTFLQSTKDVELVSKCVNQLIFDEPLSDIDRVCPGCELTDEQISHYVKNRYLNVMNLIN